MSDLYRLPRRRGLLVRADSLTYMGGLKSDSIDCVWTDPPYHLSNGGITCKSGKMVSVNKGAWDVSQGAEADFDFTLNWLAEVQRVIKPGGSVWVSGTMHAHPRIGYAMQRLGLRILNDVIWEKPAPPPNLGCRCFTHATEVIFWAVKPSRGTKYFFDYKAMVAANGGKQMRNVWRGIGVPGRDEKAHGKHPTQKPVALVERCLVASTEPGYVVLDPFCGSATTGVAALNLGRRFLGIEQHPDFFALARRRLAHCASD